MTFLLSSNSAVADADAGQQSPRMAKGSGKAKGLSARIAQARKSAKMTQTALSQQVGTTRSSVSQWESGLTEPTPENLRTIAMQTGRSYEWLATGRGQPQTFEDDEEGALMVPLKGYVRAGAQAQYLPLNDDELDRVEAVAGATDKTVALEIRGDSLGELFDRWLVFFDDVRSPVTPDLMGKLCVAWVDDGRVLVKKIKKQTNGLFTLLSNYEQQDPPIVDVRLVGAARVKAMVPH